MVDNDSYNQGLWGTGMTPNTDLDSYQIGKSIRDNNERIMAENNASSSSFGLGGGATDMSWPQPQPVPVGPSVPVGAGDAGGYVGGGYVGGSVDTSRGPVSILLAIVYLPVFLITLPFWMALYPLSALGIGASVYAGVTALHRVVPTLTPAQLLYSTIGIGILAMVVCSRIEQLLAKVALYRWARYAVRCVSFALFAIMMMSPQAGVRAWASVPYTAPTILRNPTTLGIVVASVAVLQFLTTRAGLRTAWHGFLATLRLRSPD